MRTPTLPTAVAVVATAVIFVVGTSNAVPFQQRVAAARRCVSLFAPHGGNLVFQSTTTQLQRQVLAHDDVYMYAEVKNETWVSQARTGNWAYTMFPVFNGVPETERALVKAERRMYIASSNTTYTWRPDDPRSPCRAAPIDGLISDCATCEGEHDCTNTGRDRARCCDDCSSWRQSSVDLFRGQPLCVGDGALDAENGWPTSIGHSKIGSVVFEQYIQGPHTRREQSGMTPILTVDSSIDGALTPVEVRLFANMTKQNNGDNYVWETFRYSDWQVGGELLPEDTWALPERCNKPGIPKTLVQEFEKTL